MNVTLCFMLLSKIISPKLTHSIAIADKTRNHHFITIKLLSIVIYLFVKTTFVKQVMKHCGEMSIIVQKFYNFWNAVPNRNKNCLRIRNRAFLCCINLLRAWNANVSEKQGIIRWEKLASTCATSQVCSIGQACITENGKTHSMEVFLLTGRMSTFLLIDFNKVTKCNEKEIFTMNNKSPRYANRTDWIQCERYIACWQQAHHSLEWLYWNLIILIFCKC